MNKDPTGASLIKYVKDNSLKFNNNNISFENLKTVLSTILSFHKGQIRMFTIMKKKEWLKQINEYINTEMTATQFAATLSLALKDNINKTNWKKLIENIKKDFDDIDAVFYYPCVNPYFIIHV